jgi:hypothetical protein
MNGHQDVAERPRQIGIWRNWIPTGFSSSDRGRLNLGEGSRPDALIYEDFYKQVCKASELRDFLLTEGYPHDIPDKIIEDIENARELLKNPDPPTREQRADLLKAYRDLMKIPRTSVNFEGIALPPPRFWQRFSWLLALLVFSILPSIVIYYFSPHWAITLLVVSMLSIWCGYVFTGAATNSKLNQIIKFCYAFTGIALLGSIIPFVVPVSQPELTAPPPVGIIRACGYGGLQGTNDFHPPGIRCIAAADKDANKIENYQWVLSIGGTIDQSMAGPPPLYKIRGGMIVPLYVIILALFGSAISMTRRVPEYQRRAMDSQEGYTNERAREDLVFQIMQVLSAPLIAITAYYIVKPDSTAISVALGFGSGFASEPILLMIRSLVEKLAPTSGESINLRPIEVRMEPLSASRKAEETQQFTAKVLNSPNSEVTWTIDPSDGSSGTISQSGYYVAPKSPVTQKTATITARSVADRTKFGRATVTLQQA